MAVLALAVVGCGSSGSAGSAADPASAVPASAPLYIGALIQPSASLKSDAASAASKLTHLEHPYEKLLSELQIEGSSHITWSQLKPWVGQRAGLFLNSIGTSSSALGILSQGLSKSVTPANLTAAVNTKQTQGALLLDISDLSKARSFLKSQAARGGAHGASYDGVHYELNSQGQAYGVVGEFAVIGDLSAIKSVIETVRGHRSLLAAPVYRQLSHAAASKALANAYISSSALASASHAAGKSEAQGLELLSGSLAKAGPTYLSLTPTADSIELESVSRPSGSQAATDGQEATQAFGRLPGDAWLALGLGDIGPTLKGSLQGLSSLTSGGAGGLGGLLPKLNTHGVDVKADFLSWMGSAGVFVSGTSLLNIQAAVEITSRNPAASQAAVSKVATLLHGSGASVLPVTLPEAQAAVTVKLQNSPVTIYVADGRDASGASKFVIGLGEASINEAFNPSSALSGSPEYSATQKTLGAGLDPTLMVDFPTLLGFMEGLSLQENPTLGKIIPYLRSLDTLSAGSGNSGQLRRSRVVLSLH